MHYKCFYNHLLAEIYKQHLLDMSNLQFVIKATEDKLNHQLKVNQEQVRETYSYRLKTYYLHKILTNC